MSCVGFSLPVIEVQLAKPRPLGLPHLQDSRYIVAVYLYLSTISWMYDTDVDMGIDSKSTVYDEISLPDANSARSLMIVFAALPVAIIIIGVGVWVKRRNS